MLRFTCVLILSVVLFGHVEAQDKAVAEPRVSITSIPRVPAEIHDALGAREFEQAVKLIDAAIKKNAKSPVVPYLLYLKGRAQVELQQLDSASETYSRIAKEHASSGWAHRAKFGLADVLVRKRDYQAAGVIYREAAERLLSDGRRDELAAIYLEFADRYFDGIPADDPSGQRKPEYKQALTYYQAALGMKPSLAVVRRVQLRVAASQFELGQRAQAAETLTDYLERFAAKDTPKEHCCTPEQEMTARYELGRAHLANDDRVAARKEWKDFVDNSQPRGHAGELLAKAAFGLASTYGIPSPSSDEDLELGVEAHEHFLRRFLQHKWATKAKLQIAQSYANRGRVEEAIVRLQSIIAFRAEKDVESLASAHVLLGGLFRSQKKFVETISVYRMFLTQFPTDKRWAQVQRLVIDVEFQAADDARRQKDYAKARKLWLTFLNKYPLDHRAATILFRFGHMNFTAALDLKLGNASFNPKPEAPAFEDKRKANTNPKNQATKNAADSPKNAVAGKTADSVETGAAGKNAGASGFGLNDAQQANVTRLFNAAITDWRKLVSKYPQHADASRAQLMIGITLETQLLKLAEALDAFKQVTGPSAEAAKQRIANLTATQLEVSTERKFRSNESPVIKIESRNIEQLTVKVYRIDMEDYFRKMHLARGVESLDIALIDPDKTWQHKVDGYEAYRRLENSIAIPFDKPGVAAVTVSSDKMEATTMVVVSDLDMIVKCSRNELFVFVQDMLKQQPAENVELLLSDGEQVFATVKTGKDGVVQQSFEQLKTVTDLRVFAVRDAHVSSSVSNLDGLDFAVGLSPNGFLFTDRAAYRAGELVNIKGIIRWVNDDRYTFKPGTEYKLDVFDARGRVVHNGTVKLNSFGTLFDQFVLPAASPQGTYRVHVHDAANKQSYESSFSVHAFKLEPVHIKVDVDRTVFYRGETIEGSIRLAYYYGTPLANRDIQYNITGGPTLFAKTDANGEVKFRFDTQQYNEEQPLHLDIEFPERNLGLVRSLYLATRGFDINVSTLRNVYINGETFDVSATITDPSGEPVATGLKLDVLEQIPAEGSGQPGERLVESHGLKSDKTGTATQTLSINKAGRFLVRVTGTDQFGHKVSSSHTLKISGENDAVRLRILADRHNYNVGDTANVQLHWRDKPVLALVTFEGAAILGHRLLSLKTGSNKLSLPMDSKLAPNFQLAVAVMDGNRFHQAQSEFRLTRQLNIQLKPSKSTLQPGEQLEVGITVTDASGKPVEAELSLGLIEKNLLDRFGEQHSEITEFFGRGERQWSLRTMTSSTFEYRPETTSINEFVLAEANRKVVESLNEQARMLLSAEQRKQMAVSLLEQARTAIARGDNGRAAALARRAGELDVLWDLFEDRPEAVLAAAESQRGTKDDESWDELKPSRDNTDGDGDMLAIQPLVERFNALMGRQQWAEAEQVAVEAMHVDPNNPVTQTMKWKARFARRIARNEDLRDRKENAFIESLNEVEESAIAYFGKPMQGGDDWADISKRQRNSHREGRDGVPILNKIPHIGKLYRGKGTEFTRIAGPKAFDGLRELIEQESGWAGVKGSDAALADFEVNLSLVIRQTQNVHTNLDDVLTDLNKLDGTLLALNQNGEVQVVNGLAVAELEALAKDGFRLLPKQSASATGFWDPVITTDKNGKATVKFRLPERSTAWSLLGTGTNKESLTGSTEVEVITKKDLFGELKTPLAFVEGDKAKVLVDIHNAVVKKRDDIGVQLTIKIGSKTTTEKKAVTSTGPGVQEVAFDVDVTKGDSVEFSLKVVGYASSLPKAVGQAVPDGGTGHTKLSHHNPKDATSNIGTTTAGRSETPNATRFGRPNNAPRLGVPKARSVGMLKAPRVEMLKAFHNKAQGRGAAAHPGLTVATAYLHPNGVPQGKGARRGQTPSAQPASLVEPLQGSFGAMRFVYPGCAAALRPWALLWNAFSIPSLAANEILNVGKQLAVLEQPAPNAVVKPRKLEAYATVTVPIRPYGMEVFASTSGTAAQSTIAFIEHDKKLLAQDPRLEIVIGPSVNRSLLDAVLGSDALLCGTQFANPSNAIERAVSDVLGGVALLEMVRKSSTDDSPEAVALAGRVQASLLQLVSTQRDDGAWNWSGTNGKSDPFATSRIVWSLASARRAGFAVPDDTFNKAVQSLRTAYTNSDQTDREGQAIILHGLAEASAADFAFANRLYRERNNLSESALLHLALALERLDRKEMAGELLGLVGQVSNLPEEREADARQVTNLPHLPWMSDGVEINALHLLARSAVNPADTKIAEIAKQVMAARTGSRWSIEKANGPAIAGLAGWFARAKSANAKYALSVFVNSKLVKKLDIDPAVDPSQRVKVPAEFLKPGKQQEINFDIEGRGQFSYSAVLAGFVPAARLKSTTDDWRVTRSYEPAQRMLDGRVIPRGFDVLSGAYKTFRNPLTQLPVGERGEVTVRVTRGNITGQRNERFDYLVVTEPIPAGAMVLTESISGSFERYEIMPGAITFYVGNQPTPGDIRYTLVGYLPGQFRIVPTLVRSFYRPDRIAVAAAESLDVLARGEVSKDKYKLTPVELYELGRRHMDSDNTQTAFEHLTSLFCTYRLKPEIYRDVVERLFRTSLKLKRHTPIVEYFEIIKERYPDVDVPFDSILQVAAAYRELGEYERSYLVYRATVESAFERESQIAGFLHGRGEFIRSVQVMERMLREYPAESYVAMATYALAQEVYGKAAEASSDKRLRDAGISRVHLIGTSVEMLDHFVSTWPTDPTTDQASFSLATALLDMQQYERAIARSEKFAARYADSKLLDSFWYVIGYSHFALGQHEQSLTMCRKVSEFKYTHPDTREESAARNKWESVYIMGQVFHSLGKAAEAIVEYDKVKERFTDAVEAIDFFTRKAITLPEVTTSAPGKGVDVKLDFRNVATLNTKVYRIDLLKFGLMQRNLNRITAINLAGIRPYHESNVTLGDGKDYRERQHTLKLPLKDEGAYLIVCQGENQHASGLALVSPLKLDIQEDATSGRVRVTVKNTHTGAYSKDVHVKVIGSANTNFIDGETDLRGIFIADEIKGTGTVIARAGDNQYAFYRGTTSLGGVTTKTANESEPTDAAQSETGKQGQGKPSLLDNVFRQNFDIQNEQRSNYRDMLNNSNKGTVKAKLAR